MIDITIILIAVLAVVVLYVIFVYNNLNQSKVRIKEAHSGIEVQMKRRADLVPNLVNTVKGYATHESGVFERVSEAREKMLSAQGVKQEAEANNMLIKG